MIHILKYVFQKDKLEEQNINSQVITLKNWELEEKFYEKDI